MNFHEAAEFLTGLPRFRDEVGLESVRDFLSHCGDPHEDVAFVQVAGSNGKGSTARMVERILREAGYDVGLYTSPHLQDVRERIRVDGRPIPRSEVTTFVERSREYVLDRAADDREPTNFEALTALACWHFGRADVDVAVLEVGLGGRYDATSVVDPVASAVTTVSLEHTSVLGETVAEIAREKAQVAPAEGPLVTAATGEALAAVRAEADDVTTVGTDGADEPDVAVAYEGPIGDVEAGVAIEADGWAVRTRLPTPGAHQAANAGVAAALARRFDDVDDDAIARGIRNAHWPGRFEVRERDPLVVLDGAHNPAACASLAATLGAYDHDAVYLVFGAVAEKDHAAMIEALGSPERALVAAPETDRAADPAVVARRFERAGVDASTVPSIRDGLADALAAAEPTDAVVVTGSLYAVADARTRWTTRLRPRRSGDVRRSNLAAGALPDGAVERVEGLGSGLVFETSLPASQATRVDRAFGRIGGECALAGLETGGAPVDVVLAGSREQFARLAEALDGRTHGLDELGDALREHLGDERQTEPRYPWQAGPAVMGILNVTPDSFHDGGAYDAVEDAVARAAAMVEAGADVVDVGGESTRPGADPVPVAEEIDRVVPVVERLAALDALVSVDTRKAAVAEAALDAGADVLNDVTGLEDPEMRFLAAEYDVPLIVMHSIDAPVVPGRDVTYDDVVADVIDDLAETVLRAEQAGLDREQIVVDPGLGFGKSAGESFELLGRLGEFDALGCPILVGHSHKSMFERVDCGPAERLAPTVAATAMAVERGADIVRIHDVAENVAAVKTALAATDDGGR